MAGCSGIGLPASRIGLCDSETEGLFCIKSNNLKNSESYAPEASGQCNRNGIAYFCDDPSLMQPTAIDIETRKNELKRTLPKDLKN